MPSLGTVEHRPPVSAPGGLIRAARILAQAVALLVTFVLLVSALRQDGLPWLLRAAVLALALTAAFAPGTALLVVALITPVATVFGVAIDRTIAWPELVVVAFAAGWCVWWLRDPTVVIQSGRLRAPVLLFAALVLASIAVQLGVVQERVGTATFVELLWSFFTRQYLANSLDFPAMRAGALLLEGLLLFVACGHASAGDPRFARRAAGMLALGGAAAALLNIRELADAAARSGEFWQTFAAHLARTRVHVHHGDLNAAGSHFAMLVFVALALAFTGVRTRWVWALPAALLAAGLWISGSRAALAASLLVLGLLVVLRLRLRTWRGRAMGVWLAAGAAVLAAFLLLAYAPIRGNQAQSATAAWVRVGMAEIALRMTRERPVFGVGLGEFHRRSGEFASPELLRLFPPAQNENAHNNFLQVLAELGLAGLLGFSAIIAVALTASVRSLRSERQDTVAWGATAGALTFLMTMTAGHPLLIREPAYAFWMVLALAGRNAFAVADRALLHRRAVRLVVIGGAVAIAASVVPRMQWQRHAQDLEHVGIGVSAWRTAEDGTRYREAEDTASLFVPDGTAFRFSVRAAGDGPARLQLTLGGRAADVTPLVPGRWNEISIPARSVAPNRRFTRLDLRILTDREPATMWVTKVEPLGR